MAHAREQELRRQLQAREPDVSMQRRVKELEKRLQDFEAPVFDEEGNEVGTLLPPNPPAKRRRTDGGGLSASGGLSALAVLDQSKVKQELAETQKELAVVQDSEENLNMMCWGEGGLEAMRREMKQALLHAQKALIAASVPSKLKSDKDKKVPFYYSVGGSADSQGEVPWNDAEKRAFTPAEGIEWLQHENDQLKEKLRSERAKGRDHSELEHDMVVVVKERDELRQLLKALEAPED